MAGSCELEYYILLDLLKGLKRDGKNETLTSVWVLQREVVTMVVVAGRKAEEHDHYGYQDRN